MTVIVEVNQTNLAQAAMVHSISWQDSHRAFCTPEFVAMHTPEHQQEYLKKKMNGGSKFYLLALDSPIAIVSVTDNLIEDLYVLPHMQNRGYGTKLLQFAIRNCTDVPTLWILENNLNAARLYRRMGFQETGRINAITDGLNEIEFSFAR